MDIAFCTLDNQKYDAWKFSELSESEIKTKRRHLQCLKCKMPAYFVKESKNGKAPHFGAKPHTDDCEYASEARDSIPALLDEDRALLAKDVIKIDFNYGANDNQKINHYEEQDFLTKSEGKKHEYDKGVGESTPIRRLSSILRILLNVPSFKNRNTIIQIDKYEYKAKNLFRQYDELTEDDIVAKKNFKGVYGVIYDIGEAHGYFWINFSSNAKKEFSIRFKKELLPDLFSRFKGLKNDLEALIEQHVLCLGFVNKFSTNKLHMTLKSFETIVFLPPQEKH